MSDWNPLTGEVLVFQGSAWEAEHFEMLLTERGITVRSLYLPSREGHELYVPSADLTRAEELIRAERQRHRPQPADVSVDVEELDRLELLGARIRRYAVTAVAAPAAVVLGFWYFARASRHATKPAGHADTVLAWVGAWIFSVGFAFAAMYLTLRTR